MDRFVDERDFRLLAGDRYTFSVLHRVLQGPCGMIRTDHERLILCHTVAPYPVWIWTPDCISDTEKEQAWQLTQQEVSLSEGYRYNLKYELAEFFIDRAKAEGFSAGISTHLFAYDCPEVIAPKVSADGYLYHCTPEDLEEVAQLIYRFNSEVADGNPTLEDCRNRAQQCVNDNTFFLWKNSAGETVACCNYQADGSLGCVGSVYTKPQWRRRHYAQHLVYQVSCLVAQKGLMPMLYTDADYAASNACYEKIGYILRGKLCTIAAL